MKITKENIKILFKKTCNFLFNPRLFLCVFLAWMITNGWSYVVMAVATYFKIAWLMAIAGAYLSFLWFPFTPEKIITVIIAIKLLKIIFPNDEKTLAVLKELKEKYKQKNKSSAN